MYTCIYTATQSSCTVGSTDCSTFTIQTGAVHTDYYHDSDLAIGTVINVWGRKVVLCDCDDFTKEFYRTKYGIGEQPARLCVGIINIEQLIICTQIFFYMLYGSMILISVFLSYRPV